MRAVINVIEEIFSFLLFKDLIYLFMRDGERGRDIRRRRSRLPAGSLMWDSIPRPQDHDLSQRQTHSTTEQPRYLSFLFQSLTKQGIKAKDSYFYIRKRYLIFFIYLFFTFANFLPQIIKYKGSPVTSWTSFLSLLKLSNNAHQLFQLLSWLGFLS